MTAGHSSAPTVGGANIFRRVVSMISFAIMMTWAAINCFSEIQSRSSQIEMETSVSAWSFCNSSFALKDVKSDQGFLAHFFAKMTSLTTVILPFNKKTPPKQLHYYTTSTMKSKWSIFVQNLYIDKGYSQLSSNWPKKQMCLRQKKVTLLTNYWVESVRAGLLNYQETQLLRSEWLRRVKSY